MKECWWSCRKGNTTLGLNHVARGTAAVGLNCQYRLHTSEPTGRLQDYSRLPHEVSSWQADLCATACVCLWEHMFLALNFLCSPCGMWRIDRNQFSATTEQYAWINVSSLRVSVFIFTENVSVEMLHEKYVLHRLQNVYFTLHVFGPTTL
jgi:hypothetical protein